MGHKTAFLSAKDAKNAKKSFLLSFAFFASFADRKAFVEFGEALR